MGVFLGLKCENLLLTILAMILTFVLQLFILKLLYLRVTNPDFFLKKKTISCITVLEQLHYKVCSAQPQCVKQDVLKKMADLVCRCLP